ncbi:hypothetical protein DTW90_36130 [Neorhizobium sp. P12A]|uniref:hypothetical protein n=1 Tax=Neorhizobium sp. P12A TaxID=2268027 RepID=UPI0011EE7850|nr:hypothetical protein [Neorhizobium sp. P12A]KAA0684570.1 hypothetical protein DTW90_36130 [Neorhizobium sp. P12A]
MNTVAHKTILARHKVNGPFGIADQAAEDYLIKNGFARYTRRPLMLLTPKGQAYAKREKAWLSQSARARS